LSAQIPSDTPAPTSANLTPDSGYPVPTGGATQPSDGYPIPGESTQVDGGYPESGTESSQTTGTPETGSINRTPKPGSTIISKPTLSTNPSDGEKSTNWVYPLLGSMIGLSLVLLVGYFLWKNGYMALPFLSKQGQNEDHSLE
jgi:hypothetical protein